jgi:hypothetical protein
MKDNLAHAKAVLAKIEDATKTLTNSEAEVVIELTRTYALVVIAEELKEIRKHLHDI